MIEQGVPVAATGLCEPGCFLLVVMKSLLMKDKKGYAKSWKLSKCTPQMIAWMVMLVHSYLHRIVTRYQNYEGDIDDKVFNLKGNGRAWFSRPREFTSFLSESHCEKPIYNIKSRGLVFSPPLANFCSLQHQETHKPSHPSTMKTGKSFTTFV